MPPYQQATYLADDLLHSNLRLSGIRSANARKTHTSPHAPLLALHARAKIALRPFPHQCHLGPCYRARDSPQELGPPTPPTRGFPWDDRPLRQSGRSHKDGPQSGSSSAGTVGIVNAAALRLNSQGSLHKDRVAVVV